MADLRTEEEQIEVIKNWWKENGRSTVIGVVAAVVVVFGWKSYQQYEQDTGEKASAIYQNMLQASGAGQGQGLSEEQRMSVRHLAGQLKTDYADLAYADYAAFWLAKDAVEQGDLTLAQKELEWILASKPSPETQRIANLRLARVILAQGNAEQALATLDAAKGQGFDLSYLEVRGDILLELGRVEEARASYQKAVAAAAGAQTPVLTLKLEDLAAAEG